MISVVIPAHNESQNLKDLLQRVVEAFAQEDEYEIVVVDDGSTDDTWAMLQETRARIPVLRPIRHMNCCGQSTALLTGIHAAKYAWIGTLDGDGQNDPFDLPEMLKLAKQQPSQATMIVGHRQNRKDSWWRLFCSRIANGIRSRLLKDSTPDSGCGIKLFPKKSFERFPYFDHMHRFMPALMRRTGGQVISSPVLHHPRIAGKSHYGTLGRMTAGIMDLAGVAWLMWRTRHPVLERNPSDDNDDR